MGGSCCANRGPMMQNVKDPIDEIPSKDKAPHKSSSNIMKNQISSSRYTSFLFLF